MCIGEVDKFLKRRVNEPRHKENLLFAYVKTKALISAFVFAS